MASLIKLATLWGIIHLSWLDKVSEDSNAVYFSIVIILIVGFSLIIDDLRKGKQNKYLLLKLRGIVGILLVIPCLLKLAVMWGFLHLSWFESLSTSPWEVYLAIGVMLYIGFWLIIDGFRSDRDQWLRRPLPFGEDGKRISCSASFGGDEYVFNGEPFHGARLVANFGGIRMDLRKATITEDEEIDICTCFGGVELFVPDSINIEVKSRSFIGGVGNKAKRCATPDVPTLHIVASNVFGGVNIEN